MSSRSSNSSSSSSRAFKSSWASHNFLRAASTRFSCSRNNSSFTLNGAVNGWSGFTKAVGCLRRVLREACCPLTLVLRKREYHKEFTSDCWLLPGNRFFITRSRWVNSVDFSVNWFFDCKFWRRLCQNNCFGLECRWVSASALLLLDSSSKRG